MAESARAGLLRQIRQLRKQIRPELMEQARRAMEGIPFESLVRVVTRSGGTEVLTRGINVGARGADGGFGIRTGMVPTTAREAVRLFLSSRNDGGQMIEEVARRVREERAAAAASASPVGSSQRSVSAGGGGQPPVPAKTTRPVSGGAKRPVKWIP